MGDVSEWTVESLLEGLGAGASDSDGALGRRAIAQRAKAAFTPASGGFP